MATITNIFKGVEDVPVDKEQIKEDKFCHEEAQALMWLSKRQVALMHNASIKRAHDMRTGASVEGSTWTEVKNKLQAYVSANIESIVEFNQERATFEYIREKYEV